MNELLREALKLNVSQLDDWLAFFEAEDPQLADQFTASVDVMEQLALGFRIKRISKKEEKKLNAIWRELYEVYQNTRLIPKIANIINQDHGVTPESGASLLANAIRKQPAAVLPLISAGANVNSKIEKGVTPLHVAARYQPDAVQILIDSGADINAKNEDGYTALLLAARLQSNAVPPLIDAGADVNSKTNDGYTALSLAAMHQPSAVQLLINAGADVNSKTKNNWTPLLIAARYQPHAIQPLIDAKTDIDAKTNDGYTALLLAARYQPDAVQILIDADADIDAKNKEGYTALHFASRLQPDAVQTLINAGADIEAKTNDGYTALLLASRYQPDAVQTLIDAGADIDAKTNNGYTALHFAARFQPDAVQPLIDAGADINVTNEDGETPLLLAAQYQPRAYQPLIDAGATRTNQITRPEFPKTLKLVELESSNTPLPDDVEVFDPIMQSNEPLDVYLDNDDDNIIFVFGRKAFGWTRSDLQRTKIDQRAFFYECPKQNTGLAVNLNQIIDIPYIKVEGEISHYINADQLYSAIRSKERIFVLKENNSLPFTASIDTIMIEGSRNFRGKQINVVSSDHCQAGSDKKTYSIFVHR